MNYECEFRDFLIKHLKEKFQIFDETNLLLYLHLRYDCLNNKKTTTPKDFMSFLLHELYIIEENDGVVFENHFLTTSFAMEDSLHNIFSEWEFRLFSMPSIDLNGNKRNIQKEKSKTTTKIKSSANRKIQKYKNSEYKEYLLKYFKLMELNRIFKVSLTEVPTLPEVKQLEIRLTQEELLERYLQAETFNSTNTKTISESQLRDYLFSNLHLLNHDLIPIEKESVVGEGRVDILAKDNQDNLFIIEIKTENDKRLIWQCIYYQEILKNKYKETKNIYTITVCPEYPEYLLIALRKIPRLEMYKYIIHTTSHKIEDVKIEKFTE